MTESPSPLIVSGMQAANAPLEAPLRGFLETIVQQPAQHAKFMNMLSMLEHMGSRKIMLSQMHRPLTEDSLKHLAEEARHAYFFKRQAERIAGWPLVGYTDGNTMCRTAALMYFGRLDAGISARVLSSSSSRPKASQSEAGVEGSPCSKAEEGRSLDFARDDGKQKDPDNQAYPWVSMIIELRACWLYHMYHAVLEKAGIKLSLKSLLAEEDLHMAEMFAMVGGNTALLRQLSTYETALFQKFWLALAAELSCGDRPAQAA